MEGSQGPAEKSPPPLELGDNSLQSSVQLSLSSSSSSGLCSPYKRAYYKLSLYCILSVGNNSLERSYHLIILSSSASVSVRPYAQPVKESISFSYRRWRALYRPCDFSRSTSFCGVIVMYAQNLGYPIGDLLNALTTKVKITKEMARCFHHGMIKRNQELGDKRSDLSHVLSLRRETEGLIQCTTPQSLTIKREAIVG